MSRSPDPHELDPGPSFRINFHYDPDPLYCSKCNTVRRCTVFKVEYSKDAIWVSLCWKCLGEAAQLATGWKVSNTFEQWNRSSQRAAEVAAAEAPFKRKPGRPRRDATSTDNRS